MKDTPYRPLVYLACPYSHAEKGMMEMRYFAVTSAAARLMGRHPNLNIFSPITHSHPLHLAGMPSDWSRWKKIDTQYLRLSKQLYVLMLSGWDTSVGVSAEIEIARRLNIPILYIDPVTLVIEAHEYTSKQKVRQNKSKRHHRRH
jgi:hypothetical protein